MNVAVKSLSYRSLEDLEVPESLLRQLRRADDFIRLGVVSADSVLTGAGGMQAVAVDRTGFILGSAFGPMQTNFEVLDQVVEGEPVSPTLFSHSVFNAAAGYMANILDISGCAVTMTDFSFPFFRALEQGRLAILSGRLDSCLVLQVETYSELLQEVRLKQVAGVKRYVPGAVCWLLEKQSGLSRTQYILDELEIRSQYCTAASCLQLQETVGVGAETFAAPGYLGAAACITREMEQDSLPATAVCTIESLYGSVNLSLQR